LKKKKSITFVVTERSLALTVYHTHTHTHTHKGTLSPLLLLFVHRFSTPVHIFYKPAQHINVVSGVMHLSWQ